jgi:hypothetical protein
MSSKSTVATVLVTVLALAGGVFIGCADSHSDDVPVTLALLVAFSFLLGCLRPWRPWLWTVLIGIWVPMLDTLLPPLGLAPREPSSPPGLLSTLAVLGLVMAVCFAGAFAGALVGRAARHSPQSKRLSHKTGATGEIA